MAGSGSGQIVFSDIFNIDNVIQNTGLHVGRNLLIDTLREVFRRDKEYHFVSDIFGFPKTPSQLGLPDTAGITDNLSTRIFVGASYRYDISYLPAITVKPTNISYKPISFNQEHNSIKYGIQKLVDGEGNESFIKAPVALIQAGAWDQTFEVKISTLSAVDTASITDVVAVSLQGTFRNDLQQNGLFIKRISGGGESIENINQNDPVFHSILSVETYSNWRREIPYSTMIDRVSLCFEIDISPNDIPATDLAYHTTFEIETEDDK